MNHRIFKTTCHTSLVIGEVPDFIVGKEYDVSISYKGNNDIFYYEVIGDRTNGLIPMAPSLFEQHFYSEIELRNRKINRILE